MKTKDYRIHESVLNTFLHLRSSANLRTRPTSAIIPKDDNADQPNSKLQEAKAEKGNFRMKRERKVMKERKERLRRRQASLMPLSRTRSGIRG